MTHRPTSPTDAQTGAIAAALEAFAPISLSEISGAALLDRVDVKFVVAARHLAQILPRLTADYRVLDIGGVRLNQYQTVYFDTPDFALYHEHHNGCSDRYKVRSRRYVESEASFFEVKHRTNRNRTVKSRVPLDSLYTPIDGAVGDFLERHTPYQTQILESKLQNDYRRATLVSRTRPERVTIDLDVAFSQGDSIGQLDGIAIIEVKKANNSQPSAILPYLRQAGVRPASMSKYCTGVVMLYDAVKRNNFKAQIRLLDKLINAEANHVRSA